MNSAVFSDPAFWLLVIFVIPLIIHVPIAVALGFSALVIVWGWDMGIGMISYNFFAGVAKFPLLAIPFFILAGYIMERAGIAARIIELMEALVGDKTGGLAVANAVAAVAGESATSDLVTELAFGSYNKLFAPNRTKVDWLSADESNVDDYIADPLCGADATVGLFRQMLHGIRFNQRMSHLRQMDKGMPVLFVAGDKDPVGSCGKGVRQTCDAFRQAGMRDCTLKLYPGLRHEILNEKAYAAEITKDIETWLLSRLEK